MNIFPSEISNLVVLGRSPIDSTTQNASTTKNAILEGSRNGGEGGSGVRGGSGGGAIYNALPTTPCTTMALYDVSGESTSGNTTAYNDQPSQPLYTEVIIVMMYVLIIVVAVGGNLLCAYIIVIKQKIWTVTNLFLLNLTISDVVKALVCNPFSFMANLILQYWPYGDFMCPVVTYVQCVAVFVSALTLVAMSLDRYVAILNPMRPKLSKSTFALVMATIWVVSLCIPLPTAITSTVVYMANSSEGLCVEQFEDPRNRYIYSIFLMVMQYFLPLFVITLTNGHIGFIVWIKKTPGEAEQDRDQRMAASKRRLIKMIITCVLIYAVCWLPLHVITLVGDTNPDIYDQAYMKLVWLCAHWLAMSHSCYNPIVYFSFNNSFRRNLKRMFRVCLSRHRRMRYKVSIRFGKRNNNSDSYSLASGESFKSRHSLHLSSIARYSPSARRHGSISSTCLRNSVHSLASKRTNEIAMF